MCIPGIRKHISTIYSPPAVVPVSTPQCFAPVQAQQLYGANARKFKGDPLGGQHHHMQHQWGSGAGSPTEEAQLIVMSSDSRQDVAPAPVEEPAPAPVPAAAAEEQELAPPPGDGDVAADEGGAAGGEEMSGPPPVAPQAEVAA
jgi:hypothetical protein